MDGIGQYLIERFGFDGAVYIEDIIGLVGAFILGGIVSLFIAFLTVRNTARTVKNEKDPDDVTAVRMEDGSGRIIIYDNNFKQFPEFIDSMIAVTRLKFFKKRTVVIRDDFRTKMIIFMIFGLVTLASLVMVLTSLHILSTPK